MRAGAERATAEPRTEPKLGRPGYSGHFFVAGAAEADDLVRRAVDYGRTLGYKLESPPRGDDAMGGKVASSPWK